MLFVRVALAVGMVTMQIILNGKDTEIKDENITIKEFLATLELPKIFVVEKNSCVIYKENYETEVLSDGDIIEIASFCGGG